MNAIGAWKWDIDIYKGNFVLLSCPVKEIDQRVREAIPCADEQHIAKALMSERAGFGDIDPDDPPLARCVCFRRDGYAVVGVWLGPNVTPAVVAHEAFHAAAYVLARAGATLNDGSEEAYAYLIEWLVRGIHACLDGSTDPAPPVTLDPSVPATPDDPAARATPGA